MDPRFYTITNDVRFLTYRHFKPVKVGKVTDHLKKVSKNFLIVRETDKVRQGGYHYHAIMIMDKEPHKGWYTKGVHIDLRKIGRPQTNVGLTVPLPDNTVLETKEMLYHEPERLSEVERAVERKIERKVFKTAKRKKHIDRVVAYLNKEQKDPQPFVDYTYVINGRFSHSGYPLPTKN